MVRLCLAKNPEDRPGTAWLIEAARAHPATGGELRIADGWLPEQVISEIHRHTDLPTTPPPPATLLDATRSATVAPATPVLSSPAPDQQQPTPATRRAATTARRRARTALLTTAAFLVGGATIFVLPQSAYFDHGDNKDAATTGSRPPSTASTPTPPSPSTPPPPTTAPGYSVAYTNLELTSLDSDYEFDLKSGKVTQSTTTWYLGRENGEYYVPDDSAAYIPPAGPVTLTDCIKGIDTQPASVLPFTTLRAGRSFCVRYPGGQDIAIIRTLTNGSNDDPVKVSLTYYRRSA